MNSSTFFQLSAPLIRDAAWYPRSNWVQRGRSGVRFLCWVACAGFWFAARTAEPGLAPLPRAHSHNDYLQKRPLLDALELGFCSVEADIYLQDGELRVAHDSDKTKPGQTLQRLYLEPLAERARKNGGRVYPGGPEITLLIDIKAQSASVYPVLRKALESFEFLLTRFTETSVQTGAVRVILSGDRPVQLVAAEKVRLCAIDGRIADLEKNPSPTLFPLISDTARVQFADWRKGPLPESERLKLVKWVKMAHSQGRRIRFWAVPDEEEAWRTFADAGVDHLNTDRLAEFATFLRAHQKAH